MFDSHAPQRYSAGDTIRIGMEFRDESGVGPVYALFVNTEHGQKNIGLRGNGGGATEVTVDLEAEVTRETAPGEYRCQYIDVHDVRGNYATLSPGTEIRFYVDQPEDDYEAPEFISWRFKP